jgi:dimethylargininase
MVVSAGERGWGGQSMVAPLRRVLVSPPVPPAAQVSWQAFGYLRPIDHALAEREHAAFCALLAGAGVDVVTAAFDGRELPDAIFVHDPAIIADRGAILGRMGKALREPEVELIEGALRALDVPIAGRIRAPGRLEGGDCLWLDARTLAVGRGYRTNAEGIRQLGELLADADVRVIGVDLPHWRGPDACLHLLSLISPVDERLAVAYPALLPAWFVEWLDERGVELIEVPEAELATQGCNVLALAPRRCLLLRDNRETGRRLEAAGCKVLLYAGDEISHNRGGGPTCLTRPLWRAE